MAFKTFELDEQTTVKIYKRRGSRSLKLTVTPAGEIRVSIPSWTPYQAGLNFAKSRQGWIAKQRQPLSPLRDGLPIGKAHHLRFVPTSAAKPTSRLQASEIIIRYPFELSLDDPQLQAIAVGACERAMRLQAEQLLPKRLAELAEQHDLDYRSVTIKKLKSRWGSCDHQRNIVLNLYLMQLPWDLIDYVLLHELTHTQVLKHGPDFWAALVKLAPASKTWRRQIRAFQPSLQLPPA